MMSCARCRLRGLIRSMAGDRRRWAAKANRNSLFAADPLRTAFRALSTSVPVQKRARNGAIRLAPEPALTQRQQVELVERLYTSGQISKAEWRESVFVQAGLKDQKSLGLEEQVRRLREWFAGDGVPNVLLREDERKVHERLFGDLRQIELDKEDQSEVVIAGEDEHAVGTGILREAREGSLEELEFEDTEEEASVPRSQRWKKADQALYDDMKAAMEAQDGVQENVEASAEEEFETFRRTHPLTSENRFSTSPSTLEMPRMPFVDPVTAMLSGISDTHLSSSAHKIFGGAGLPYSTSTPTRGKLMPQKPISLDAHQSQMSEIEADVFVSTLMPGMYSSMMSVLIETRKRLGTQWAEDLVRKAEAGTLRILDAGSAGAGVIAVREMLRAEWERIHEDSHGDESPMALAEADGNLGGENVRAPMGSATVLTGADTLRKRVSKLLDNTTFVPRLPDYVHTEEAKKKGKFDLVLAPHGLWPLREDYLRKTHVQNLWSLLSTDGGVLLLLEKGVARGFELVAGARDMLLESRIASPKSLDRAQNIDEPSKEPELLSVPKETGMIIAPCTNHTTCPMYIQKGLIKGRRDICAFSQRYHRPAFLQSIFGTKGRNHEDVEFSYLSVMRGRDYRPKQDADTTDRAFSGYEEAETENADAPSSLSLPRSVYPPLKRQGHVILDLCTPAGKLERWTVPKSFSKVAYRDARKASWGDLWPLGAKTRVLRTAVVKKNRLDPEYADLDVKARKGDGKRARKAEGADSGLGSDDFGRVTIDGNVVGPDLEGGRMRGRKVKGIRDRRDKRGDGNGRKLKERGFD